MRPLPQTTPIDRVLSAIESVTGRPPRTRSGYWTCVCPAHEDRTPSLSVSEGDDGRVLLKCHAGCPTDAVVGALGLEVRDLFVNEGPRFEPVPVVRQTRPRKQTTTEYLYEDAEGTVRFKVIRIEDPQGKRFRVQTPLHKGWVDGLNGQPTFPYRLPRVVETAAALGTIFFVEGEKCVAALEDLGLTATTLPGSAGAWDPAWTAFFRGAGLVVILPDNDEPGQKYAEKIADGLADYGGELLVVDLPGLPHKGDVADWLGSGASLDDLRQVVKEARAAARTASAVLEVEFGPRAVAAAHPWPALNPVAFDSPIGMWATYLDSDGVSEADPTATLIQALVGFSSLVGPGPHLIHGTARIPSKINALIVGQTSQGRKGTSLGDAATLLKRVDPEFFQTHRQVSGFGSGEALLLPIRDEEDGLGGVRTVDRRLWVVESEFARILDVAERKGSTLSATLRDLFDCGSIANRTKAETIIASEHHVAIVGHITPQELAARLTALDAANGFANRFLLVGARRTRLISRPRRPDDTLLDGIAGDLNDALTVARNQGRVEMSDDAWDRWDDAYETLERRRLPALVAALAARSAAYTLRLALLHALMDSRATIEARDIDRALAIVEYATSSALHFFGEHVGDEIAERLLSAAREAGKVGLTGTERSALFGRNKSADQLDSACRLLTDASLAAMLTVPRTGGHGTPTRVLVAAEHLEQASAYYGPNVEQDCG